MWLALLEVSWSELCIVLCLKQKENKVLSGVEVLIQTVNKDTPKHGELESTKGITERKIEDLKRQLKKTEGKSQDNHATSIYV